MNAEKKNALHYAIDHEASDDLIMLLVAACPSGRLHDLLNAPTILGDTALSLAIHSKRFNIATLLTTLGIPVQSRLQSKLNLSHT
jgi:ankyrin repeat protein